MLCEKLCLLVTLIDLLFQLIIFLQRVLKILTVLNSNLCLKYFECCAYDLYSPCCSLHYCYILIFYRYNISLINIPIKKNLRLIIYWCLFFEFVKNFVKYCFWCESHSYIVIFFKYMITFQHT